MKSTASQKNRRTVNIAALFVLALVLTSCSKVKLPESELSFSAEYIRDITFFKGREKVILIDTFEDFLYHFEPVYSLWPGKVIYGGSTINEEEIKERYTESWFLDHQLIIVGSMEESGSTELKVAKVRPSENGCMFVEVDRFNPVDHHEDVAIWQMLIEIDRCLEKGTEFTLVFHNQE